MIRTGSSVFGTMGIGSKAARKYNGSDCCTRTGGSLFGVAGIGIKAVGEYNGSDN